MGITRTCLPIWCQSQMKMGWVDTPTMLSILFEGQRTISTMSIKTEIVGIRLDFPRLEQTKTLTITICNRCEGIRRATCLHYLRVEASTMWDQVNISSQICRITIIMLTDHPSSGHWIMEREFPFEVSIITEARKNFQTTVVITVLHMTNETMPAISQYTQEQNLGTIRLENL